MFWTQCSGPRGATTASSKAGPWGWSEADQRPVAVGSRVTGRGPHPGLVPFPLRTRPVSWLCLPPESGTPAPHVCLRGPLSPGSRLGCIRLRTSPRRARPVAFPLLSLRPALRTPTPASVPRPVGLSLLHQPCHSLQSRHSVQPPGPLTGRTASSPLQCHCPPPQAPPPALHPPQCSLQFPAGTPPGSASLCGGGDPEATSGPDPRQAPTLPDLISHRAPSVILVNRLLNSLSADRMRAAGAVFL